MHEGRTSVRDGRQTANEMGESKPMDTVNAERNSSRTATALTSKVPIINLNPTVLVVEDEDFVREVTCEVLESAGYGVLRARTAIEATRMFPREGRKVDLLLTDVVLPGRSGRTLAKELTALDPALKTMFVSGYCEDKLSHPGASGKAWYLAKPFSVETLLRKVKEVLEDGLAGSP
jgi:CheY-like chemotaxis protein